MRAESRMTNKGLRKETRLQPTLLRLEHFQSITVTLDTLIARHLRALIGGFAALFANCDCLRSAQQIAAAAVAVLLNI